MDEPSTATGAAEAAAEAVRALNHLTMRPPGLNSSAWDGPDVYAVLGWLRVLLERLPQTCDQLARGIAQPDVVYGSDNDADPSQLAAEAITQLRTVATDLDSVRSAVAAAQEAFSHLRIEGSIEAADLEAGE